MNTTETDLIFEAYAKSRTLINEGYKGNESREKNIMRGDEAISAEQESYYEQFGAEKFEEHYGFAYPQAENEEGVSGDFFKLLDNVRMEVGGSYLNLKAAVEERLGRECTPIEDEWIEEMSNDSEEDNEKKGLVRRVRSEGAVNLLEQLKAEVPELEDKINQVLEKVFDAVDILKQESYADDPQLQKVYASLIQGDF